MLLDLDQKIIPQLPENQKGCLQTFPLSLFSQIQFLRFISSIATEHHLLPSLLLPTSPVDHTEHPYLTFLLVNALFQLQFWQVLLAKTQATPASKQGRLPTDLSASSPIVSNSMVSLLALQLNIHGSFLCPPVPVFSESQRSCSYSLLNPTCCFLPDSQLCQTTPANARSVPLRTIIRLKAEPHLSYCSLDPILQSHSQLYSRKTAVAFISSLTTPKTDHKDLLLQLSFPLLIPVSHP